VRGELANVRTRVDGVPILGVAIETLRHDVRTLRAAINDMARVNITAGEVEALHADVDRMGTKQIELEARLSALERQPA
jgi:ubiquinone biosynthesis protein UbiJ